MFLAEEPKNTKSPGLSLLLLVTFVPLVVLYCACAVRAILIPFFLNICWVKPEQSAPVTRLDPPHT